MERFGGGEGKAHLLYSWPLSVKQALWAVTERRAFSSLVPAPPPFPQRSVHSLLSSQYLAVTFSY